MVNLALIFCSSFGIAFGLQYFKIPNFCSFLILGFITKKFHLIDFHLDHLSHIGILFLVFAVGMEISFDSLKKTQKYLKPSIVSIIISCLLGFLLLINFYDLKSSLLISSISSASCTAIVIYYLCDNQQMHTDFGKISLSFVISQDLFSIFLLFIMKPIQIQTFLIGIFLFGLFLYIIQRYINSILHFISMKFKNLFFLFIISFLMTLSFFTEHLGLSSEFGALCAGVLIANTDFSKKTHHAIEDWKDIFLMFFFIETGTHINLLIFKEHFPIILIGTLSFIAIRIGSTLLGKFFSSISTRKIIILSLVFCNVSEAGFLIIQYLFKTNHISELYYEIILLIFLLSLFLSPFFLMAAKKLHKKEDNKLQSFDSTRMVIVGVNKYTYELAKMLKKQHVHFSIIDKNVDKIVNIRTLGYKAYLVDFFSFQNKLYFDSLDLLILTYNTKKDMYRIIEIKEDHPNLEIICLCSDERSHNLLTTYNINCVKIPSQETLNYIIGLSTPFINKFNSYGEYGDYE